MLPQDAWAAIGEAIRRLLGTTVWKVFTITSLGFGLFGTGFCVLIDFPDDPVNVIMDVLMTMVLIFFILELALRCIAEPQSYPLSSFFFMDILGTASMIFEVSYLLGHAGRMDVADSGVNAVLMRTARAARVGARVGRLTKLMRCLAIFYGRRKPEAEGPGRQAKVLTWKLMVVLSTKVSILTIVLVLGVPLFSIGQYPAADLSMRAWSRRLEADYSRAYATLGNQTSVFTTDAFQPSVQDMVSFYADLTYFPYRLEGYSEHVVIGGIEGTIPGERLVRGQEPNRKENIVKQQQGCAISRPRCRPGGHASIYFDLTETKQQDAVMDMAVIVFVILCMCLEAFDLSQTLNSMVVRPVEKMLDTVQLMRSVLQQAVAPDEVEEGDQGRVATETVVVERVLKRLARLVQVLMEEDVLSNKEMVNIDHESRGVIVELMRLDPADRTSQRYPSQLPPPPSELVVANVPVDPAVIDSWELDVLGLPPGDHDSVVCHIFLDSDIGRATGRTWTDLETLRGFLEAARGEYLENPYHCYAHACDVVASCARLLRQVQWRHFLSDVDAYALLVAALCHDVGHPGRTNPFLVETTDELALRYNDRSPLENMHCAKLFEICRDAKANVFKHLSRDAYKHARGVCIMAILHTDNAQHFEMVKEFKRVYEVAADICDRQARDPEVPSDQYVQEVLCNHVQLWHKAFVHLADIANPLKPFEIYKAWAARVMDEFFAQGDEEKRLGIPVGMLNDREKVSRPGSEHGFINFLVAPLTFGAVSIFPTLQPLAAQMASNLEAWRDLWVQQSAPPAEDLRKRDADVQRVREQVEQLQMKRWASTRS